MVGSCCIVIFVPTAIWTFNGVAFEYILETYNAFYGNDLCMKLNGLGLHEFEENSTSKKSSKA